MTTVSEFIEELSKLDLDSKIVIFYDGIGEYGYEHIGTPTVIEKTILYTTTEEPFAFEALNSWHTISEDGFVYYEKSKYLPKKVLAIT